MVPILTWRKKVNNKQRHFLPAGDGARLTFQLHIDDNGCQCLRCTGQSDQYAMIQSYRDSCDLALLLRSIDPNSLANAVSSFSAGDILNSEIVDYSTMPTDLGSMFALVQKGENLFNGLPESIRAEFNYSVKNFVKAFGTPEFADIINKYVNPATEPVTEPVTEPASVLEGGNE